MNFIDFFAGVGGFRRGLELSGHKCVGFCEWDKYATASYTSMHLITDKQHEYLSTLTMKQRQKEILKDEYRNGEWYSNDIRNVDARRLPTADCWCFGAPCQDFSIAGKRAGLDGDRSSLIREIFRLLEEQEEQNRPEWLIYENVKGMLSSNRGLDYLSILSEMDRLGYDIEWQNINSKWFVPQNRERIYTVGHLRRFGRAKILPVTGTDGENSLYQIASVPNKTRSNPNPGRTYSIEGIGPCLSTMQDRHGVAIGIEPKGILRAVRSEYGKKIRKDYELGKLKISRHKFLEYEIKTDECSNTIDSVQKDNLLALKIKEATKQGYALAEPGDSINLSVPESKTRRGRVGKGVAQTLDTSCNQGTPIILETDNIPDVKDRDGIYVELPNGVICYAIWYEKEHCYITIRKLTPKECFRLQGWTDDYFEKAAFVNSDSQLYKQAGNGVTVDVVYAIGKKILEYEKKSLEEFSWYMNKPEKEAEQTKGERR